MGLHTTTPQYDSFSFTLQIHGGLHWVSVLVTPLWTLCRFLQYTIVIVRAYIMARLLDFDVIPGGTSCNQEPPPVNRLSEVQSHHQMSWWPRVFWKWPFYCIRKTWKSLIVLKAAFLCLQKKPVCFCLKMCLMSFLSTFKHILRQKQTVIFYKFT